jgi:O-methyltransferase
VHNTFITRHFDWDGRHGSRPVRVANPALRLIGKSARVRAPYSTGYMSTIEQRINLYHFISQLIAHDVRGDLIEVGTFVGETAVLISKVLEGENNLDRKLHVYDSFEPLWNTPDPLAALHAHFAEHRLPLPEVHKGWFKDTMPDELPDEISFAHIDCGWGGDPKEHEQVLLEAMAHIYPRMTHGAICSIVDYTDTQELPEAENAQPGVKPAFDKFMADKPEQISILYAGEFGHAYFRKL